MHYDAIVIGARVAGAATAMLLARQGRRVLAVDRAVFPCDTVSTHLIWQHGVNRLLDWSLGDRLADLGAPPMSTVVFDVGPFALAGTPPTVGRAACAYGPRRKLLDSMLVDAAREAGSEVREGFAVDEIVFDGDRVAGIRGRTKSGKPIEERASIVVGADGARSLLARAVWAREYNVQARLACWYYSYWSGIARDRIRFFSRPGRAIGCLPTNDGLVCIPVAWPQCRFREVKQDIEGQFLAALAAVPDFQAEVLSGRREERFYGTGDVPNYFRKPYGPGWALVGDAGYHKDPILAQGISDAFRDAERLAGALRDVFDAGASWESALGSYEEDRNAAVEAIYGMNTQLAALEPPPPEMQKVFEALVGKQEDTNRFLGTMSGATPVAEFYSPENLARIVGAPQAAAGARGVP